LKLAIVHYSLVSMRSGASIYIDLNRIRGIARAKELTWDSAIEKTASLVHQMAAT
jgi:hypothetical protein